LNHVAHQAEHELFKAKQKADRRINQVQRQVDDEVQSRLTTEAACKQK
jgi:hypothetical protein